jgi:hypothetical protein
VKTTLDALLRLPASFLEAGLMTMNAALETVQRTIESAASAGLTFIGKGHGANFADLFRDGRLSVLVASGGAYPGDLLTTSVYYPKRLPRNYLNVRLTGTKSNRDAIGARIALQAGGRRQYREVSGGSSFGCLPLEQHFGLGDLTTVDSLEIRWPSGLRQRLDHPPTNRTIPITEDQGGWVDVYQAAGRAPR